MRFLGTTNARNAISLKKDARGDAWRLIILTELHCHFSVLRMADREDGRLGVGNKTWPSR